MSKKHNTEGGRYFECAKCSALVYDILRHTMWHEDMDAPLDRIEAGINSLRVYNSGRISKGMALAIVRGEA